MEPSEWPIVCMDFGRSEMILSWTLWDRHMGVPVYLHMGHSLSPVTFCILQLSDSFFSQKTFFRMIVPILAFFSSLVKGRRPNMSNFWIWWSLFYGSLPVIASHGCHCSAGLSGMGEALVFGAGWQLFDLAGYEVGRPQVAQEDQASDSKPNL